MSSGRWNCSGCPPSPAGSCSAGRTTVIPAAAVGLALLALVIVSLLVAAERQLRRRSRRWGMGSPGDQIRPGPWGLARRLLAQALTLTPP